jgi:hypothetical protein
MFFLSALRILVRRGEHLIWETPFLLYLSVRGCSFITFCIVFRILNAMSIFSVFLDRSMIFLISFLLYVKVAHFKFRDMGRFLYSVFMGRDVVWFCSHYNYGSVVWPYNIWFYSLTSIGDVLRSMFALLAGAAMSYDILFEYWVFSPYTANWFLSLRCI